MAMTLGGLWHGAAWNFVLWGMYHGVLLVSYRLIESGGWAPLLTVPGGAIRSSIQITVMFTLVVFGWVIFRADSVGTFANLVSQLADPNWRLTELGIFARFVYVIPLLVMQFFQYRSNDLSVALTMKPISIAMLYMLLIFGMLVFAVTDASAFIYFQF